MGQKATTAHFSLAALSRGYITSVAEPKICAAQQMKEPTNWFDGRIRRMEAAAKRKIRSPDHKRMTTIVSGKGQIPIPKRLRDRMGLLVNSCDDLMPRRPLLRGRRLSSRRRCPGDSGSRAC